MSVVNNFVIMGNHVFFWICLCGVLLSISEVSPERTKDKMYESIDGAAACFRRLNGTHQFGCSSSRSGSVGAIHLIDDDDDLLWLLNKGDAPPYMAVLGPDMFKRDVLLPLRDSGKVSGVLLAYDTATDLPQHYSPDDTCPNRYSGQKKCDDNAPWNPEGMGLLQIDWGFPMFYIKSNSNDSSGNLRKIRECHQRYNSADTQAGWTLCAIEMNSYMSAAVSSEVCVRRNGVKNNFHPVHVCDALIDRNVWVSLPALSRNRPDAAYENGTVITVSARMDSTSMFDQVVPGATSPVTGIVALLATAHALSQVFPQDDTQQSSTVLFTLLHGESHDYIGSQRLLWDMLHGQFPHPPNAGIDDPVHLLYPNHLKLFVELSQLSNRQQHLTFHPASSANYIRAHAPVMDFMGNMTEFGHNYGITFTKSTTDTLPPASLQTFLVHDNKLPGVVIADHEAGFTNRYYNSIFDDASTLNYTYYNGSVPPEDSLASFIANFSTVLAQSLFYMATKTKNTNASVDATLVDELLHCYLESMNCSIFNAATFQSRFEDKPPTFYIGVNAYPSVMAQLTGQTLAYLTGQVTNKTKEQCVADPQSQVYQYLWMSGKNENGNSTGVCVKTTMNYSIAESPAFSIEGYDWASGQYSTWTESTWNEFRVRMFLKPSYKHEVVTLCIGIAVMFFSFVIVFFINTRSHVLFGDVVSQEEQSVFGDMTGTIIQSKKV
ncbi:nicastrin isoform X2 [Schistocerca serialis cubense]|uniref:nicastrin isoform X2 n=1 Tax=Schistocerca serialis cubense TaxID=2023355 RepID=UPI00214F442F|nr:nicastrin isoform X2 [Schistocerca serialis cubense]